MPETARRAAGSGASDRHFKVAIVPVTPFQQNCTLLWDDATRQGAVIDPGGEVPRLRAAIREAGVTVEAIVLTHGHIDHAGGAAELKAALSVPIVGPHVADKFLLDGLAEQGLAFGMLGARAVAPDRWLEEGEEIVLAGRTFAVLHCPGHSPGSVALYCRAERFALVGDVLFQGSIGRTDFPYGDHAALLDSITHKLMPLGDDVAFVCGHGPASTFGAERHSNPFLASARPRR